MEEAQDSAKKRRMSLLRQSTEPETTHVCKSGWLLKQGKLRLRWLKRWYSLGSCEQSFTYSTRLDQARLKAKAVLPGGIAGAAPIEEPCLCNKTWVYGFTVFGLSGVQKNLYCQTAEQRDSWVWYLARLASHHVNISERYHVYWLDIIGSGAYADVLRAKDRLSGELVAVKVVSRWACQRYIGLMQKEVQVMQHIDQHPHLLSLREVFYSENHMYLITEFMAGGDLHSAVFPRKGLALGRFSELEAQQVVRQLLKALAHLHSRGISHCDVKPENILLPSRGGLLGLKLIDYNSAMFSNELTEPGGTPEYLAPELLCDQLKQGMGPGLDMWAIGILTYWLLAGHTPFASDSIPGVLLNILNSSFVWPEGIELSEGAESFIETLLSKRPDDRPSAQQMLSHAWLVESTAPRHDSLVTKPTACCSAYELHGQIRERKLLESECTSTATPHSSAASEGMELLQQACIPASLLIHSKLSIKVAARSPVRPKRSVDPVSARQRRLEAVEDCPFAEAGVAVELVPYQESCCRSQQGGA